MNKTILALNTVSGLAHLAQIGVIYPLLALWLDAGGMPTWQIGLVETSVWLGMLIAFESQVFDGLHRGNG